MVLDLRQGLLGKGLQIGVHTIRNFVLIEGGIGPLVVDLPSCIVGIQRVAVLMFARRNDRGVSGSEKCRARSADFPWMTRVGQVSDLALARWRTFQPSTLGVLRLAGGIS